MHHSPTTRQCLTFVYASKIVSRTTSSSVVVPSKAKFMPASRSETMPKLWAALRSSSIEALLHDHVAQVVVHDHQLEQADAPLVARVVADVAAAAAEELLAAERPRPSGPARRAVLRSASTSSRHWLQMRRTSRWARIASTVAVMRNVGTPMSFRRVIVLGASLVCSVLNTMCPVSDACTAISAVSRSRISPTRMMSGSCRRMARRQAAKVTPISASIGI